MIEKDKALIGKKVKSRYNESWRWNGATVIEITKMPFAMNSYLIEKEGESIWVSERSVEEIK